MPFWLIGISNYFFASSSFKLIDDQIQWIGDIDGLLMTSAISVFILALWIIGLFTGILDSCITKIIERYNNMIRFIKTDPKIIFIHIGILFSMLIIASAIEVVLSGFLPVNSFTLLARTVRIIFYFSVGLSIYIIILFRAKPEKLFLFLSLLIGFIYITAHPFYWYGWDCGIHYAWSVEESFFKTVSVSRADLILAHNPEFYPFFLYENSFGYNGLLMHGYNNFTEFTFPKNSDTFSWSLMWHENLYHRIAHIPTGIMLFIARSIAMTPIMAVKFGTLANHLIYTLVIYFAMKRLNSGKYIMAVIAMFPTSFVLSTTYGYDQWLISFIMLGYAYFFYETQTPDKKISIKNMIIMSAALFIGIGPKAVYFPVMFILYFIKKNKFTGLKEYRIYITTVSCLIIFAIAGFAVPYITSGGGEGDWRGGTGVDAVAQTIYILQNPFIYIKTFLNFLTSYLNIFTNNFITHFAHLGYSSFYYFILVILGFVIITDRNEYDIKTSSFKLKLLLLFITLITISVFTLAMYISFTEVGENIIAGVQGRYLTPLLFPLFYIIGNFKIKNKINESIYSCIIYSSMSFVLLVGAWEKFILQT